MNKPTWVLLLLFLCGGAMADDAALRQCRALANDAARLACYDAMPLQAPVAPSAPSVPPPTVATAPVSSFGLARADEATQTITSSIAGVFEGWDPGSRIRLANGQLWQVVDDSRGTYYLRDPKVVVRRAALGSFVLDIEGVKRLPRVRRLE